MIESAFSVNHVCADHRMMKVRVVFDLEGTLDMKGIYIRSGHSNDISLHVVKNIGPRSTPSDIVGLNVFGCTQQKTIAFFRR